MWTNPQTFDLESCRDLIDKLIRELDQTKEMLRTNSIDRQDLAYRGFNLAVTAWHIWDWVKRDLESEPRAKARLARLLKLPEYDEKQVLGHLMKANGGAIRVCNVIANASKHSIVKSQSVVARVSAVVTEPGEPPVTDARWVLKLEVDGESYPALDIFENALAEWIRIAQEAEIGGDRLGHRAALEGDTPGTR